jgi:H+/Cl- antiporter ClcA
MLTVLMLVCIAAIVVGIVLAFTQFRRGGLPATDNMNGGLAKHPVRANPILIWFVLFPAIVLIGAWLWTYYIPY